MQCFYVFKADISCIFCVSSVHHIYNILLFGSFSFLEISFALKFSTTGLIFIASGTEQIKHNNKVCRNVKWNL